MGGTSEVWDYFKKVENDTKVQCLKCVVRLKYKNTTSNLIAHLRTHGIVINKQPPKGGKKRKRRFNPAATGDNSDDEDEPEEASSTSQVKFNSILILSHYRCRGIGGCTFSYGPVTKFY